MRAVCAWIAAAPVPLLHALLERFEDAHGPLPYGHRCRDAQPGGDTYDTLRAAFTARVPDERALWAAADASDAAARREGAFAVIPAAGQPRRTLSGAAELDYERARALGVVASAWAVMAA